MFFRSHGLVISFFFLLLCFVVVGVRVRIYWIYNWYVIESLYGCIQTLFLYETDIGAILTKSLSDWC